MDVKAPKRERIHTLVVVPNINAGIPFRGSEESLEDWITKDAIFPKTRLFIWKKDRHLTHQHCLENVTTKIISDLINEELVVSKSITGQKKREKPQCIYVSNLESSSSKKSNVWLGALVIWWGEKKPDTDILPALKSYYALLPEKPYRNPKNSRKKTTPKADQPAPTDESGKSCVLDSVGK
jgi:hypothetical protein